MGLKTYRAKRDFDATPEPRGEPARKGHAGGGPSFVIQKHAASRLHYDFRLEHDGVLKSWAVPKGPSLDPSQKRLAVEVEDHPIEYGGFEGTIPKGQYGGGTVMLWDRGTWSPEGDVAEGLLEGKLKFELFGERLRGGWSLVRMGGEPDAAEDEGGRANWLLVKSSDDAEGATEDVTATFRDSVDTGRTMEEIGRETRSSQAKTARRASTGAGSAAAARSNQESLKARRDLNPARLGGARRATLPTRFEPQLATLVSEAPSGDEWIHEIKFDGYRMAARVERGKARLISRNNLDWTSKFLSVASEAAALPVTTALLDGEVVVVDQHGVSGFQALQSSLREPRGDLAYFAFDLLHLDGWDLSGVKLEERKALLKDLLVLGGGRHLRFSDHVAGHGTDVHAAACVRSLEGIVCKRKDRPHAPGRGRDWLKVKCLRDQEFVVGGFTEPEGARTGLGAILVGVYEGKDLQYAGKVGTGFSDAVLRDLRKRLGIIERRTPAFANPPRGAQADGVHWVEPRLVAQVHFLEWTSEGLLRHPSFQGLREDKDPSEVVREKPSHAPRPLPKRAPKAASTARPREAASSARMRKAEAESTVAGVRISHPERVVYPEADLTKLDVARFYESIADWILPHVAGRPLTLLRCPEGRVGQCFVQKHRSAGMSDEVKTIEIEDSNGVGSYLLVEDVAGIVGTVQAGALELHVWGCRTDRVEQPDRIVFDLDPDEELPWRVVADAAQTVRTRLEALDLASFVKTTGGKGLHVVVPIVRGPDWDAVKAFSHAVAQALAGESPDLFTATMSKARRPGKIFVDYLRNGRGATWIAPYSTRAREGAPVSTPIAWEELGSKDLRRTFTMTTLPRRLAKLKVDPWAALTTTRQSLSASLRKKLGSS